MQIFQDVEAHGRHRFHVRVVALVEVGSVVADVALGCEAQTLPPKAVRLAVRVGKDVFLASDSVESEFDVAFAFCHFVSKLITTHSIN